MPPHALRRTQWDGAGAIGRAVLAEPVDITGARRRLDLVRAQPGTAGEELEEPRSFGVEAVADVAVDAIHLQRSQVELGGVDDHRHILGALHRPGTELAEVAWEIGRAHV